jgi:hypothetical protein
MYKKQIHGNPRVFMWIETGRGVPDQQTDWTIRVLRVQFQAEAGNFSLNHRVQNGSGAHPASYPVGTRGSFPGGKAAGE